MGYDLAVNDTPNKILPIHLPQLLSLSLSLRERPLRTILDLIQTPRIMDIKLTVKGHNEAVPYPVSLFDLVNRSLGTFLASLNHGTLLQIDLRWRDFVRWTFIPPDQHRPTFRLEVTGIPAVHLMDRLSHTLTKRNSFDIPIHLHVTRHTGDFSVSITSTRMLGVYARMETLRSLKLDEALDLAGLKPFLTKPIHMNGVTKWLFPNLNTIDVRTFSFDTLLALAEARGARCAKQPSDSSTGDSSRPVSLTKLIAGGPWLDLSPQSNDATIAQLTEALGSGVLEM